MIININLELEVFTAVNPMQKKTELNEEQTINVLKKVIQNYNEKAGFQKHTFKAEGYVFLHKITIK